MEQILKSELQVKSAISIGVFDIIEQLDDGMVIIKADDRTKLKFFNGELDILMHGQSHYRIKGIRSGGLMLEKAELVFSRTFEPSSNCRRWRSPTKVR